MTRKQRDTPFHKSRPSSINNAEGSWCGLAARYRPAREYRSLPSKHPIQPPSKPLPPPLVLPSSSCRAFRSFPPSFSFTFESRISLYLYPPLFYIYSGFLFLKEVSDLFDNIVISLGRGEGLLVLLLEVSICRRSVEIVGWMVEFNRCLKKFIRVDFGKFFGIN